MKKKKSPKNGDARLSSVPRKDIQDEFIWWFLLKTKCTLKEKLIFYFLKCQFFHEKYWEKMLTETLK